jgi:hypothetical protein
LEEYSAGPASKADIDKLLSLSSKALENRQKIIDTLEQVTRQLYDKCLYNAELAIELMEDDSI